MNESKQSMMYVPNQAQNVAPTMYAGLEANNLVNFYNSSLLDEMLQKTRKKLWISYTGATYHIPTWERALRVLSLTSALNLRRCWDIRTRYSDTVL